MGGGAVAGVEDEVGPVVEVDHPGDDHRVGRLVGDGLLRVDDEAAGGQVDGAQQVAGLVADDPVLAQADDGPDHGRRGPLAAEGRRQRQEVDEGAVLEEQQSRHDAVGRRGPLAAEGRRQRQEVDEGAVLEEQQSRHDAVLGRGQADDAVFVEQQAGAQACEVEAGVGAGERRPLVHHQGPAGHDVDAGLERDLGALGDVQAAAIGARLQGRRGADHLGAVERAVDPVEQHLGARCKATKGLVGGS
ncbi:hypothetical protein, partial [Methylobacterium sp. Leaf466]|uniref:hypothetical protein n=1 Tax=Methylobacterium sp. Leaf466 TaxID=1736386 RepID=UPI0012E391A6